VEASKYCDKSDRRWSEFDKNPIGIIYLQQACVGSLVGDHLLLRDFEPYGIIFMNVCVVINVAMVMLLRDFEKATK
jgi:uncharacterized YccA/Bax inhibitor family protein